MHGTTASLMTTSEIVFRLIGIKMSQVSKFTKYVKWYHVNYVNGHHVNIFMFYHVKFEIIGKYFLSCKLIFVLEKERKILLNIF